MSDSDGESSSESLKQDRMSVSEQEQELSRDEDDMPSAEIEDHEVYPADHELSSSASDSSTSEIPENKVTEALDQAASEPSLAGAQLPTIDIDDSAMDLMTGSYSEILSPSRLLLAKEADKKEPAPIQSLAQEGTILQEGDMVHFVTKNLETKIRLSSPEVPESTHCQTLSQPDIEDSSLCTQAMLLAHLEREARNIASSVDALTEHLVVSLHTISAVTVESLTVYKDSVCKTCDAMDANIKSMYQLMAKCEELSKAMSPLYKQAEAVKEIKKLLDIMENM